jgi:dolichol kinase
MLHVALADGFAAIIGTKYGRAWAYKVFGQTKTIIGSMTFWVVSLCILGIGLLFAHDLIPFSHYISFTYNFAANSNFDGKYCGFRHR